MRDIDEIERMFRMIKEMTEGGFSGGYNTERPYNNYNDKADIQENVDKIYITLELRVQEEDIQVTPLEDKIVIEVMINGSWTRNNIRLPSLVDPKSAKITFNNCILDMELNKKKESKINVNEKV